SCPEIGAGATGDALLCAPALPSWMVVATMPHNDVGPPEKGPHPRSSGGPGPKSVKIGSRTDTPSVNGPDRQCASDTMLAGLRRRREASRRMAPLDCGCTPDPW